MDEIDAFVVTAADEGLDLWIAGEQPATAVEELERALDVQLPPSFRQFLLRYGGMGIGDSFISGIINGDALGDGMGWVYADTSRFREDSGLPAHLLVVQADDDAPYCLDTSERSPEMECPVVCYELHSGHVGRVSRNFAEWCLQWLQSNARP
jgi:hypothetical protein